MRSRDGYLFGVLFAAVFLLYRPVLGFEFVWDDYDFLVYNPFIKRLSDAARYFIDAETFSRSLDARIYRPLRNLAWALIYRGGGMDPFVFHFANVAIHGLNTVLLYAFIRRVSGAGRSVGFASALFFGIHPVATETVCWIKCLDDLLAVFWGLLFLHASVSWVEQRRSPALFSKESAAFLAAAPLLVPASSGGTKKRRFLLWGGLMAVLAGYLILRTRVLGGLGQGGYPGGSGLRTQLGMSAVYLEYFKRLIVPVDRRVFFLGYSPFETYPDSGLTALWGAGIAGIVLLLYRCKKQRGWLGLFFLSFFPVSNVIPTMQWMAERFLYFPLAMSAIPAASLLDGVVRKRFAGRRMKCAAALMCAAYLAGLGACNRMRQEAWTDDRRLGMEMLANNPSSYHGLRLILDYNRDRGRDRENIALAGAYLDQFPREEFLAHYLVFSLLRTGERQRAKEIVSRSLKRFPESELLKKFRKFLEQGGGNRGRPVPGPKTRFSPSS
jgi:hypothetical protein